MSKTTRPPEFNESVLVERLRLNSTKLIKELYEVTQRKLQYEAGRQQRLDAKATSLLTAAGLSLTVASTFGAKLLSDEGKVLFSHVFNYLVFAFCSALVLGLVTAGFALFALLTRNAYRTMNDEAVFAESLLQKANQIADPPADQIEVGADGKPTESEAQREDYALMIYQKALIPHIWAIQNEHKREQDRKARVIQGGQIAFGMFLASLVAVCILVGIGVS